MERDKGIRVRESLLAQRESEADSEEAMSM
jgi:hypothetical protein